MALLRDIIENEPSTYEEAAEKKEWKDFMIEEYHWIMENDVSQDSFDTGKEVCRDFEVDLQDQECCIW